MAPTMPLRSRAVRVTRRLVKSFAIIYLLVCLLIAAFQTSLIFPGSFRQGTKDVQIDAPHGMEKLTLRTADGVPLAGLFSKARVTALRADAAASGRPTVVYFYGNGDALAGSLDVIWLFNEAGANCMAVDYPGFGMSGGKPSEAGCYAAAEAAYQHVLGRKDVDAKKIVPAGWSLGGAVAIDLAYRHRTEGTIAGLMTFSTFTSMLDMAKLNYPFLPTSLLLQHHFKSLEKAPDIHVPWLIGHGKVDRGIPFAMSERLARSAGGEVVRYCCETADHNDFFEQGHGELVRVIKEFVSRF